MKEKIKAKAKLMAQHPATKQALLSLKPEKTLWGALGVILFFILPEIIAFIWGADITHYAHTQMAMNSHSTWLEQTLNELLLMLFQDGGSWLNLGIGIALLIWLFF